MTNYPKNIISLNDLDETNNRIKNKKSNKKDNRLQRFIIDIDDTTWNSSEIIIDMINQKYNTGKTFKDLKEYDYKSIYKDITKEELYRFFESDYFFENVKFQEGFLDLCNKFNEYFSFEFLTKGNLNTFRKKYLWLNEYFKYDFGFYGISKHEQHKGKFDLSNSVIIDDLIYNLEESNAEIKILITNGIQTNYNQTSINSDIYKVNDWHEISYFIEFYLKNRELWKNN